MTVKEPIRFLNCGNNTPIKASHHYARDSFTRNCWSSEDVELSTGLWSPHVEFGLTAEVWVLKVV
jgi:hypothetical protein